MKRKTMRVRARAGLRLPLPRGVALNFPGLVLTPETPAEVVHCAFIRRRLRAGDIEMVPPEATRAPRGEA